MNCKSRDTRCERSVAEVEKLQVIGAVSGVGVAEKME